MFSLANGGQLLRDTQYRLLNVTGPGGNLLTGLQQISLPAALRGQLALLTPDDRDVIGTIVHGATREIVEMSRSTGRLRVLHEMKPPLNSFAEGPGVLSLAGTGLQPLFVCKQGVGLLEGGRFIVRPGLPHTEIISGLSAAW